VIELKKILAQDGFSGRLNFVLIADKRNSAQNSNNGEDRKEF
jgi:hypothetical protein